MSGISVASLLTVKDFDRRCISIISSACYKLSFSLFEEEFVLKRVFIGALVAGALMIGGGVAGAAEMAGMPSMPSTADKPLAPGWLSLDSSVGKLDGAIGRGKGALEKALGIGISGYFDVGWTFSTNHPQSGDAISGRNFDKDQNDFVFNGFHLALEKPEKDWGVGFKVSGDFGRTAELLREATQWTSKSAKFCCGPSAELREIFLTTTIPVGAGIGLKGGLFVTPLGTEIIPSPGAFNDNISRSFLFNFGVPLRHLGVLASYQAHKMVGLSLGIVTGWDNPHDNNHQPSFLGGLTLTPNDKIMLMSNLIYGPEQKAGGPKRFTIANVLTYKPIDPLALTLEYTAGTEDKVTSSLRDGTWQGIAGIASYSWTERFTTALRGEWFNDRDGVRLANGTNTNLGEVTFTSSYKFTKMLMGRAEVRQDWSDKNFYNVGAASRGTNTADKSQTTLGLQMVYQY